LQQQRLRQQQQTQQQQRQQQQQREKQLSIPAESQFFRSSRKLRRDRRERVRPKIPIIKLPKLEQDPLTLRKKIEKERLVEAYAPYVIKKGKEIIVGRPTVKGRALRIGETIVRKTAAATFGVKKTGKKIKARKDPYAPSPLKYRAYKVVKGKKVPIKDTFIEKRKYRISTPGERKEITRKGIEKRSKKIW